MKTLNEGFMHASASEAMKGLMTLNKTTLLPGITIYRFANTRWPDRFYTGSWWVGFSPFGALMRNCKSRGQSLAFAARRCLAINPEWSEGKEANVLIKAVVKQRLSAWSGTPKTQVSRIAVGSQYVKARLEPDRDVTQLCIPGLGETDPNDSGCKIWQSVFIGPWRIHIGTV
jgi:hypothetical protein